MYWVKRTENYDYQVYQLREKEPMNAQYFYHVTGIINEDRSNMPDSQLSLGENSQRPGYPIIEDRNGDGLITTDDIYMDDVLPKISIGFGNTFTWRNFDLDIFMYGQKRRSSGQRRLGPWQTECLFCPSEEHNSGLQH